MAEAVTAVRARVVRVQVLPIQTSRDRKWKSRNLADESEEETDFDDEFVIQGGVPDRVDQDYSMSQEPTSVESSQEDSSGIDH